MTSFLRFFILALTPLLGISVSFGASFLYAVVATLLLTGIAALVFFLKPRLKEPWLLWSAVACSVVVVTLVDLAFSAWLPEVRAVWGLYLNLLAFSPLVLVLPFERRQTLVLGTELNMALKTGFLLTLLFVGTALVREPLGVGTLTVLPGVLAWSLPWQDKFPLAILATGAGGFFLAAAGVVLYRVLRPRLLKLSVVHELRDSDPQAPEVVTVGEASPLESSDVWGEDLQAVVGTLPAAGSGQKRKLLVIGAGNGEQTYHLAMLCLEKDIPFRIRGVDHFASRIESAVGGVYRANQIEFIPPGLRQKWMTQGQGEDKHLWRVSNEPRLHVQFEVADFQQGSLFFPQPSHLIILNQGIEYVTDDKKVQLLKLVCDHLLPGGALVVDGPFKRELLPEGMKRTGAIVFRKA